MKKLIYLILISLLMMGMGCSDDDENTIISTTDYVLSENYSWRDLAKKKIYRIDSKDELLKLVEGEGDISKVDFEKSTLVVFQFMLPFPGYSLDGSYKISTRLVKESEKYLLSVDAYGRKWDNVEMYATYVVAIIIPIKLNDASIEYELKIVESK